MAARKILEQFIVPRRSGKAFVVHKGQIMRVIQIDGGQVADIKFINADDHREQFSAIGSMFLNAVAGVKQPYFRMETLYSKVPWERPMMTVLADTVGVNTFGVHCSRKSYELKGKGGHRSCEDNFRECLAPHGLKVEDTEHAGVFNAFMPRRVDAEGNLSWPESPARDGDYIDFRAEMNVLVAFSNCPSDPPVNPPGHRDMKVEIWVPAQ